MTGLLLVAAGSLVGWGGAWTCDRVGRAVRKRRL